MNNPQYACVINVETLKPTDPSPAPGIDPSIDYTIVSRGYHWQYAPQLESSDCHRNNSPDEIFRFTWLRSKREDIYNWLH
jgi:hypothetical protein